MDSQPPAWAFALAWMEAPSVLLDVQWRRCHRHCLRRCLEIQVGFLHLSLLSGLADPSVQLGSIRPRSSRSPGEAHGS
eukprot:6835536-Pyramimonas_sp.AAC.1